MNKDTKLVILAVSPLSTLLLIIPGLNILVPFVLWLTWKDEEASVDQLGRNILNAQLSWFIWMILSLLICVPLCLVFIGFILIWGIVLVLWLVFTIIQAISVSNGNYDYVMPATIRFLK